MSTASRLPSEARTIDEPAALRTVLDALRGMGAAVRVTSEASMSLLGERLDELAASLPGVERGRDAEAITYRVSGITFAVIEGDHASFRLKPDVADAAARTPGAHRSARGAGWVELAPDALDLFVLDRAVAWFEAAARYARVV